jgi:anti-sigma factor RsiW
MRCRDIRHLVIDDAGQDLAPEVRQGMEKHLDRCERCARFRESMEAVSQGVKDLPRPLPSDSVDNEVRTLLQDADASRRYPAAPLPSRWDSISIPRLIWAAIPVLVVLTALLMATGLQDILDETGSFLGATFVALLLQNAVMLVFAPILIKALRRKTSHPTWNHGDAHAS